MAVVSEFLSLQVDGFELRGFQSIEISRAADEAAIGFRFGATNPAWSAEASRLRNCKLVEIYTGGDLVCAGYVDRYDAYVSGRNRQVTISGRSKPADAIDCEPANHETGQVENKDLAEAAKEFDEWGLDFRAEAALPKIPLIQRNPGEPLIVTLEREARRQGLLLTGEPDGSITICKGPKGRHAGALVEGRSPLVSYRISDAMNLAYSEVKVRGQKADGVEEEDMRQEETASNGDYGRHRPKVIFNEGSNETAELRSRAEWELKRRNGARLTIGARVAGWRDAGGELWTPRREIAVMLESEEIDVDLAIRSVTFTQQEGEGEGAGTFAELELVYPETLGEAQG